MPKRARHNDDDDDDDGLHLSPASSSLFSVHNSTSLLDCDMPWTFNGTSDTDFGSNTVIDLSGVTGLDPFDLTNTIVPAFGGVDTPMQGSQPTSSDFSALLFGSSTATSTPATSSASSAAAAAAPPPPPPPAASSPKLEALKHHAFGMSQCRSRRNGAETCISSALRTLKTLHILKASCLNSSHESPGAQRARGIDAVLAASRKAVAISRSVLACACSSKTVIQPLLLSICGHLVSWSTAIIDEDGDGDAGDAWLPSFTSRMKPGVLPTTRPPILTQPVSIGRYEVPGKLGQALQAQVMVCELEVLEGLLDAMSVRFREARRSPAEAGPGLTDGRGLEGAPVRRVQSLSESTYSQVIASLLGRLREARKGLMLTRSGLSYPVDHR